MSFIAKCAFRNERILAKGGWMVEEVGKLGKAFLIGGRLVKLVGR